jgi:orotate phosphoribosyltransferase-like protein
MGVTKRAEKQERVLELARRGLTVAQIARELGMHNSSQLWKMLDRDMDFASRYVRARDGSPARPPGDNSPNDNPPER